jgi:drug/metabolite transporter (DMT)-like permease
MGYLVFGEVPGAAILVGAAVLLFGVAIGTLEAK